MDGRIWRPEGLSNRRPFVLLLHPGGFVLGHHGACEDDARRLVKELGCVCLATDYRRAPEYPFPKGLEDAFDAVKWAAANASKLNADPAKGFVLQGSSAGGNIAAVTALLARDGKLNPPLSGLILVNPFLMSPETVPSKYESLYKSWDQCQEAPLVPRKAMVALLGEWKDDFL